MNYAIGKKSKGMWDRCGLEYPYMQLRKEWNNLKVCPECFEIKHPQLEPRQKKVDPEALFDARSDNDVETSDFAVYTNYKEGIIGTSLTSFEVTASVGTVTVSTP